MTRENKLALVVGFGLILLVGILISDHLSVARTRESAPLTEIVDPLSASRPEPTELIALRHSAEAAVEDEGIVAGVSAMAIVDPVVVAPPHASPSPPPPRLSPDTIEMGRQPEDRRIGLPLEEAGRLPYVSHEVRRGESLSSIARHHFGDPSLARELAEYNGIENPDDLQAGRRLRIPGADALVRGNATPAVAATAPPAPERTYTVRKGDVLTGIASRLLGSASRYGVLYEHNRDVLKSPDDLRPGMTLRIPRDPG